MSSKRPVYLDFNAPIPVDKRAWPRCFTSGWFLLSLPLTILILFAGISATKNSHENANRPSDSN